MDELYIGLMSGTSADGVNAALVDFSNHFHCLHTCYQPYPDDLQTALLELIHQREANFTALLDADNEVAVVHALAVRKLLSNANISHQRICAIGFHGQTLYHQPTGKHRNSLQIGDPAILVEHTGITTVSDFRRRDMAAGGQGAPFAPAFHNFLFRKPGTARAIVNIGGIANITILPADPASAISGFDSGPGNCLLDAWHNRHQHGKYDDEGKWSRSGQCDQDLLQSLLTDHYFTLAAPKSTGREYFHLDWLANKIGARKVSPVDIQATLSELTCETIASGISKTGFQIQEVYLCGGGTHNRFLVERLKQRLQNVKVMTTEAIGLPPDWVEACAFAWFAKQRIDGTPLSLKSITGANKDCMAGAIYQ